MRRCFIHTRYAFFFIHSHTFMITHSESPPAASSTRSPHANFATSADATSRAAIDDVLVSRFVAGDESAFSEIMHHHRARVFNVSLALLRNHADAEEVTQDTFIRVHRGLAKFRGGSSLATWMYRIAVNLSRNRYWYHFRRRRQDSFSLDQALTADNPGTFSELVADPAADTTRETMAREFCALVSSCMVKLDRRHREILDLRAGKNHSYGEIAASLGINAGTVKSRIARARFRLRELLGEACPDFPRHTPLSDWFAPARAPCGGMFSVAA